MVICVEMYNLIITLKIAKKKTVNITKEVYLMRRRVARHPHRMAIRAHMRPMVRSMRPGRMVVRRFL